MAAEGATACSGAGEPPEEAGAGQQETAAEDPGNKIQNNKCVLCVYVVYTGGEKSTR